MTRKLDFIVFGLPRSGTTAVAGYLSAVPGLHCGLEVFPTFLDHSTLDVPRAFLERQDRLWNDSSAEAVRAGGDSILRYGNKTPTYFYRLPSLLDELDNCPAILCVRDLRAVATSYAKRAADPRDTWLPGRNGLFAMGDALIMLHALRCTPAGARILIVQQAALQTDWRAVMTRAAAHVAPGLAPEFATGALDSLEETKKQIQAQEKPALDEIAERALRRLERAGVPAFFSETGVVDLDEKRAEIDAILAETPPNPINFIRRMVEAHPDPEVKAFFDRWARHAGKAWQAYRPRQAAVMAGK